ncbi:MAG: PRTRC system protein D [Methyloglobulus sp.]|nr:PRTRC system protein D [Methyloglobulus sp.]
MVVCSVDVGYGNTKFCGDKGGEMFWGHFPSIATLPTGIDRGANVMAKRDLVEVESNGDRYIVGRDCMDTLSARDDRGRSLLANYVETPQHLALLRGALAYIGESRIDLLVSGLPVNHFAHGRERMTEKLKGVHRYPDGRSVLVKDAWVVPQPVGGFISYFMSTNQLERLADIKSLTIDVGYYTVDWLVCRGLKLQDERSGSAAGGMSMVMEKLAQLISKDRQAPFSDLNIVDSGIRNGFKTRIQGKEYDFSHYIPRMEAFIITAIQSVISSVGSLDDIDVIVLVGGGANFYYGIAKRLLDNREIIVPEESIYSNVRGFYLAGSERMRKMGC